MKKTMMSDIAEIANVSIKTVSRVINNSPQVKEETRRRVLEIIEREGYTVNVAAQGLKGRKTKTIIVFIDRHGGSYWSIWHNEILNAIFKESKKTGYKIVISPSSASGVIGDETDGFYLLKARLADGAIIFDNKEDDIRIKYLAENNIPYVLVGKGAAGKESFFVDLDNYEAGRIGGNYLKNHGYRQIVQFVGSDEYVVNQERVRGFKASMEESQEIEHSIYTEIDSIHKAYEKSGQLIDEGQVDAFFVSGDERAIGVYRAIHERSLRIPEDVAVLGIDNISLSEYLYPPLSTVDQGTKEMGIKALKVIVDQLNGKVINPREQFNTPHIVERSST